MYNPDWCAVHTLPLRYALCFSVKDLTQQV